MTQDPQRSRKLYGPSRSNTQYFYYTLFSNKGVTTIQSGTDIGPVEHENN